jgi:predicted Zn-ribbon and HTH transcriptional regulator
MTRHRRPAVAEPRHETVRETLRQALLEGEATLRDLSPRAGIAEREVAAHLAHLERSLRHRGERLHVDPCRCLACGFAFSARHRFTRPSRCPVCHGERITFARFRIARTATG